MDGVRDLLANISIHRNNRVYINNVPDEMLIPIFQEVLVQHELKKGLIRTIDAADRKTAIRPLLDITHVCSWWRKVAIGYPFLWTRIDIYNEKLVELLANRSQSAALSVFCDAKKLSAGEDYSPSLSRLAARLLRLDLSVDEAMLKDVPRRYLSFQAPTMRCLTIIVPSKQHFHMVRDRSRGMNILDDDVCSLSALALAPVPKWFPSNSFPFLTHLYLGYNKPAHSARLLSLLSHAP
ncbi:hypothetical protein BD311DRAFT_771017 [Dichomitus squalens]|uniref:Uncharacterized protein n=1 Tax=Dichomitus squalens TaxID=114155 RepID=A0A4Q9M7I8_9APHY|nr:hypothetical protein BD311DRAFT_771017 [Dichomitus squalens]